MPAAGRVWFYYSSSIRPFDVVKTMGKALQSDEGKTVVKSIVDLDNTCKKCQGQGYIPMFSYYCDGVCFDCYGSGYNHKFTPVVELLETKPVTI
jgi:hypothetical protein